MHEYGLMESVLERAAEIVARESGATVSRIRVEIGELAFASRESLEAAFASLSAGTGMAGARLELVEVPARLRCDLCAHEGPPRDFGIEGRQDIAPPICGACGSLLTVLKGGGVSLSEVAFHASHVGPTEG